MTVRSLTEIFDRNDTTITTITVGPEAQYAEVIVQQWELGEDKSPQIRVLLELGDAIAMRDALTRIIDAMTVVESEADDV